LQLRAEQRTFTKTAGSLQAYFGMYALNDELIACGSRPDDEEVVMLLLEGLPRSRDASTIAALTVMSTRHDTALIDTI
jgi:hypothetical protein